MCVYCTVSSRCRSLDRTTVCDRIVVTATCLLSLACSLVPLPCGAAASPAPPLVSFPLTSKTQTHVLARTSVPFASPDVWLVARLCDCATAEARDRQQSNTAQRQAVAGVVVRKQGSLPCHAMTCAVASTAPYCTCCLRRRLLPLSYLCCRRRCFRAGGCARMHCRCHCTDVVRTSTTVDGHDAAVVGAVVSAVGTPRAPAVVGPEVVGLCATAVVCVL